LAIVRSPFDRRSRASRGIADDLFRQAAFFADRILRGGTRADLPVQVASKFETAINLATAKALGSAVPPALLVLVAADEVSEGSSLNVGTGSGEKNRGCKSGKPKQPYGEDRAPIDHNLVVEFVRPKPHVECH